MVLPGPRRMTEIRARAVGAAAWGFVGTVVRIGLQLVSQVTLARLLGPDQYGLFAVGLIVVSLAVFISDFGLAYGLIQKKEVSEMDERFVFTWQAMLGMAVMLSMIAAASAIAGFFGEPRAEAVVRNLSIVCLLTSLSATSQNLLKRAMDFRWIHLAQVVSYFTGFIIVGVPMAYFGQGVHSLIVAWCTQSLLYALILFWRTRHSLTPVFWHAGAPDQFRYGLIVLSTNVVNWFTGAVDKILVGKFMSAQHIGLYSTMHSILYSPTAAMMGVLQQVFFSAASRSNAVNDAEARASVASGYAALSCAVGIFVAPFFCVLATLSRPLVELVYGPSWLEAATLFLPIALAMPLLLIWGITTPLLWSGSSPLTEVKYQLPVALVFGFVCYVAAQISVESVAWCFFAFVALRTGLIVGRATKDFEIRISTQLKSLAGGACLATTATLSAFFVDQLLSTHNPLTRVSAATSTAFLAWSWMLAVFFQRITNRELRILLSSVLGMMPARVVRLHARLVGKR